MRNRRQFLLGLIGGIPASVLASNVSERVTPSEIEGPFYPIYPQKDKDFDLTRIAGHAKSAAGKPIFIAGSVRDTSGAEIEDATVDIWQANAAGRYRHPHDNNPAPLDPNFQGWAIVKTGKTGQFRFKTVMPGAYPASNIWTRPPHIHFKVSKLGYAELTTQMYFPNQALNDIDLLLQRKSKPQRNLMIARKLDNESDTYEYVIYLSKL